jgi:hypothetical protein
MCRHHFASLEGKQALQLIACWGELEYLNRNLASRKRRRKVNPVPGSTTGPPCSGGISIWEPGPPGWGSLRWDSKTQVRVLGDSDHWVIAIQNANPSARQRGSPTETRPQISDSNVPTGSNIWSQVPEWARNRDTLTDWPIVSRKVTSASTSGWICVKTKSRPQSTWFRALTHAVTHKYTQVRTRSLPRSSLITDVISLRRQ